MAWLFTPAAGVLFLTTAVALVAAGIVWRRGSASSGPILCLLMLAAAVYTLATGLEAGSVALSWKLFWAKLQYVGSGTVSTLLLLFAARTTGRNRWLHGWRRWGIWIPPTLILAAVTTNEYHHWIWAGFAPGPPGSNLMIYIHGLGFYLAVAVLYVYICVAGFLLIRAAIRPGVVRRRQLVSVLLGTLFPFAAGILYVLDITPLRGLDPVPISVFFSAVILIASSGAFRVFDLAPVARDVLVEKMSDAVIVLDAKQRIVDLNPAAGRLLCLGSLPIGAPVERALPIWRKLKPEINVARETHLELALETEPLRYVDVRVTPLPSQQRPGPGCLIVFRDITQKHGTEISLQEANQHLSDQVQRIERLQLKLRDQAVRDSLTGLFNRRYLGEVFPRALDRVGREGHLLCVVLLDIDRFKDMNDRYGHEEGDRLLATLGKVFRERTRSSDVACRYGGEEFLLVLPGTDPAVACARAEEIRSFFADLSQSASGRAAVTLSAGIAVFPWHGCTPDALIRAADKALYSAKKLGRDRTCVAPKPMSVP